MKAKYDVIGVQDFQVQVCGALGLDPMRVKRIIIDLNAADCGPLPVYVEMVGDSRLPSLDWAEGLKGAEIIREPKEE